MQGRFEGSSKGDRGEFSRRDEQGDRFDARRCIMRLAALLKYYSTLTGTSKRAISLEDERKASGACNNLIHTLIQKSREPKNLAVFS